MVKKILAVFLIVGVFSLMGQGDIFARGGDCPGGKWCPFEKRGCQGTEEESYPCPVTEKFMKKAHFFLENQKELGLSEDQVKAIKELKLETKKAYLRQMSEHQIFSLDIEYKLSDPKLDVRAIQGMIDQHMQAMSAGAKQTIEAYAQLRSTLSEDQLAKAKELWLADKN